MIRLGPIDFDQEILRALRDDELVIFAGAGVSMGEPSNLPSFHELVSWIAEGTKVEVTEPLDRVLGQLDHNGVKVHERAAQCLINSDSKPNQLHEDLLRLFGTVDRVRVVTTNFDTHFETAAELLFGRLPDVYRAPALPLGRQFRGIVHVHGSVSHPNEMVLTDADFGRAYLTEGWARRFLVEVFRSYTVVFVGYSHNDTVMNYLARALPIDRTVRRFALTDDDGNWGLLGIKPIRFTKRDGPEEYKELYDGVHQLSLRARRGVLDWKSRLAEIGSRVPPVDPEVASEIDQALQETHTTRFFTEATTDVGWPQWLAGRGHLDSLFSDQVLIGKHQLLAFWLANNYAIEHPDEIFALFKAQGMRINPILWEAIAWQLARDGEELSDASVFTRWVTILLSCIPSQRNPHVLASLAERCTVEGQHELALRIFLTMCEHDLAIDTGFVWGDHGRFYSVNYRFGLEHWHLDEVWKKCIKPYVAKLAQPLLTSLSRRFEMMSQDLQAWNSPDIAFSRSAIEPHDQDKYPTVIDVLIDAARDALEALGSVSRLLFEGWIEGLLNSNVNILHRLAIHAAATHPEKSPCERLEWLLNRVGLHPSAAHHEVHRFVALNYSQAREDVRQLVVDEVLMLELPALKGGKDQESTDRLHFNWLSWLLKAKPNCAIASAAIIPIRDRYPDWRPSEHPDLLVWSSGGEWVASQSPLSVDQLLAHEPEKQLDYLLEFRGDSFRGPDRAGLLTAVRKACKSRSSWSFKLAEALTSRALWSSDLWQAVLGGWREADLTAADWQRVLQIIGSRDLSSVYARNIAGLLLSIVEHGGKPFALEILEPANEVALSTWRDLDTDEKDSGFDDWLTWAINRPAGLIVEFWIQGLSFVNQSLQRDERVLPDHYRSWLTEVVEDSTLKGALGRTILAGRIAFLFSLDPDWTHQHLIPLFSCPDSETFRQVWDGFLSWGHLYPELADSLLEAFLEAMPRLENGGFGTNRSRFIDLCASLAIHHLSNPTQQFLPLLFSHSTAGDKVRFGSAVSRILRRLDASAKVELWERWLRRYWRDRNQGVPIILDPSEVRMMLTWVPNLGDAFPQAVELAIAMPETLLGHTLLFHDLGQHDLVQRYPNETATLLVYLSKCLPSYQLTDLKKLASNLKGLTPEVRRELKESLALAGIDID